MQMPELMDGALIFGFGAAVFAWILGRRRLDRRLVVAVIVLIAVAAAYLGPPVFALLQEAWRGTGVLPDITEGMAFVGLFVALLVGFMAERKGRPRRVPVWMAVVAGGIAAFAVPMVVDGLTGTYQRLSLRADVNACTQGMLGDTQPRDVTNICDFPITVGMCLSDEESPASCRQVFTLAPGEVGSFAPGDQGLSSSGKFNGLTVVACRPPNRPSRWINNTGKAHVGVCIPAG